VSPTTDVPTGNTYDKYASTNPIERRLVGNFLGRLDAALPAIDPARILEVGIGEGAVAARVIDRFPTSTFVGIDLPDPELAGHWSTLGLTTAFGDVAALPFPDASFDLVLAVEVLEHVPDPGAALRELARVATRDVVITVPHEPVWRLANLARGKYLRALGNTPGHVQHWSRRAFVRLVAAHFSVEAVATPFPWTLVRATRPGSGSRRLGGTTA
jgi:ubiquinone/menaquinone biosynthesis C-methylase UbiE